MCTKPALRAPPLRLPAFRALPPLMLMMRPQPAVFMNGMMARAQRSAPTYLTLKSSIKSSSMTVSTGPVAVAEPPGADPLLTRMCRPPSCSAASATLAESKTPMESAASAPGTAPPPIDLDTAALDRTLGAKGSNNGGIYQFGIPRAEPVQEEDMVIPASMGLANAINFQPLGGGKAAITGDFVLIDKEVAPVMKALRENGIEVTALHNHMVGEQPRLYFMHFWAHDDALKLAAGLKAALAHINVAHG